MKPGHQLDLVHLAIRSGVFGHIDWKDSAAQLLRDDVDLLGIVTPDDVRALLRQFVLDGNTLEVRDEIRNEYLEENPNDLFWYRAIIPVQGVRGGLFIEVRLVDDDPKEPWIEIVSAHRQRS